MRRLHWVMLLGLLGPIYATCASVNAEEGVFVVLAVTTDLQRSVSGMDKNTTACVAIDASALRRDDGVIRWTTLDFDAMRKALLPLRKGREAALTFHLVYRQSADPDKTEEEFRKLLRWALVGFGQEQGFRNARWLASGPPKFTWEEHWAMLKKRMAGKGDADEPRTGNELVTVHPVRTLLSRHLFDNADCVATIVPPFEEDWDGTLTKEMSDAIDRYVSDLKLENRGHLYFRLRYKATAASRVADQFYQHAAKELAGRLGFETHNVESGRAPVSKGPK
jgi:hypothetical protein